MRVLFIFLDGVGLGVDDPEINPFARVEMPRLQSLLGGRKLLASSAPFVGERGSLLSLDAALGVPGLAQSATGQAVLLTGINVPARIGEHYGPKPNPAVVRYIRQGNIFSKLKEKDKAVAFLNAYPPRYFHGLDSGRRLYSAIPLAAASAGVRLRTKEDLFAGQAMSADFTGSAWRSTLGFADAPVLRPEQAGKKLAELASQYYFSLFEYWATDYAGHRQDMGWAVQQLEIFDRVLGGVVDAWDFDEGLILITSDHGNMEDLSTRRHTGNQVPIVLIGRAGERAAFSVQLKALTDVAPAIINCVGRPTWARAAP